MKGISRPSTAASTRRGSRPITAVSVLKQHTDDMSTMSAITRSTGLTTRGGRPRTRGLAHPSTTSSSSRSSVVARSRHNLHDTNDFGRFLQQKEALILQELAKLRAENETMERDRSNLSTLEANRDGLSNELYELEGVFSDLNLVIDRARSRTDPVEIDEINSNLAARNEQLADEVDRAFVQTQQREKDVVELEKQLTVMHKDIEAKLITTDNPDQLEIYRGLMQQMKTLQTEGRQREEEIRAVDRQVYEMENSVGARDRKDYQVLASKAEKLKTDIGLIDNDLALIDMPISEAREYLVDKTEADKEEVSTYAEKIAQADAEIEQLITDRDVLLAEISAIEMQQQKDDKSPLEREEQMNQFFSTYEDQVAAIKDGQSAIKYNIDLLREKLDDQMTLTKGALPTQEALEDLRDDVSFTTKQVEASESTMERLRQMKLQREQELEKIEALEGKIADELVALDDKMISMDDEVVEYDDLVGLQSRSDLMVLTLVQEKEKCSKMIRETKPKIAQLTFQYQRKKDELESNKNWDELQRLEGKLSERAVQLATLREFVERKKSECEYKSVKANCLQIARNLNKELVESLA